MRKELRAGPGGPRPVLLADQLTIPPIFRIADTHLHTSRDSRGETLRLGFTRAAAADVRHRLYTDQSLPGDRNQVSCSPDTTHSISQDAKYGSAGGTLAGWQPDETDLAGALDPLWLSWLFSLMPLGSPPLGFVGQMGQNLRVSGS